MKNLDNEKIANCCLQVFYLLQMFSIERLFG